MVLSFRFISILAIILGLSLVLYSNTALSADTAEFSYERKGGIIQHALRKEKKQYQIGETWSRLPYSEIKVPTDSLLKALSATAQINVRDGNAGTSFYLGKVGDHHLMVTNYHVMSTLKECKKTTGKFTVAKKRFRCQRILNAIPHTETTFFTIGISENDGIEPLMFDFINEYKPGHKIVVAGYGEHKNFPSKLTYDNSPTCVVATSTFKPKFLSSLEDSKIYSAYSFVHACEISRGDSGAALLSESTGKVIGVNWATSTRKASELQFSNTVLDWIENNDSRMWSSMSYGVPALEILNALRQSKEPILHEFISMTLASPLQ